MTKPQKKSSRTRMQNRTAKAHHAERVMQSGRQANRAAYAVARRKGVM